MWHQAGSRTISDRYRDEQMYRKQDAGANWSRQDRAGLWESHREVRVQYVVYAFQMLCLAPRRICIDGLLRFSWLLQSKP